MTPEDHPGGAERLWRSKRPVALGPVLSVFRRGAGDPTILTRGTSWWIAARTPHGASTLSVQADPGAAAVIAKAWGDGAQWMLDRLPLLLGDGDDDRGFVPRHDAVAAARRAYPDWRVPASGLVLAALVPAIIEQKVTGQEAFAGYRALVSRFGEPAPGPGERLNLVVPPTAAHWAGIPSWEWLGASVDHARSSTVVRAARVAGRLEQGRDLPSGQARARLESIPGIGRWTSAEVAHRAFGDADAVSFGDYHVAKNIGWALIGEQIDDERLAELLEPYEGHRYRVQRLLELAGAMRPRHGPRMAPRTHLPVRRRRSR